MSLQVWLPLTKDLRNQGLANVTVTNYGATLDNNGKLGKCYYFDGTDDRIAVSGLSLPNVWSYSCWIYSATSSRSWEAVIMLNSTGGDSDLQLGFYTYPSGNRIQNTANGQYNSGIAWTYGMWHHFCGTFDGSNLKTYIDGILINTKAITASLLSRTNLTIGARSTNAANTTAGTFFQGRLNDVRIYDHCLSPMEVKELAKGLVLHYPLNRQGWGQDNHFRNSNFTNGTNSWYGVNSSSIRVETKDGRLCGTGTKGTSSYIIGQTSAAYTGGTTVDFTISAKVYVSEAGTIAISNWITTTQASGWQSMSGTRIWNTSSNLSVGWNYISTTLKNATNQYTGNIVTAFGYSGTTFWITDVKFEFGNKATPWCPNSSDTLATTMGLNSTTEYDCSGFGNNGTRTGTFTWTSDTPKYQVSTIFDGSNTLIEKEGLPAETKTIISWIKWYSLPSGYTIPIHDKQSGLAIGITSANRLISYVGTSAGGTGSCVNVSLVVNQWYHIAVIKTGDTTRDVYINGEKITSMASNNWWGGDINNLYIGGRHSGGSYRDYFNGQICDVRAYATALSADDIKSLYQNSAYIDSSGNVYGAVHSEI